MAKTINFVSDTRRRLTAAQQRDKELMSVAAKICVGFIVVFLLVIGARLLFVYQVKQVQEAQKIARQHILDRQEIEKEYNIFAHKLRQLSDLFGKRKDKQEAMVFFSQVFGPNVIISAIDYTSDRGDFVSFSLKIPSVFAVDDVYKILHGTEVTTKYSTVTKNGLSRGGDGSYALRLTIALGDSEVMLADEMAVEAPSDIEAELE
jgi:hypothetical protein